ncbi:pyridoxal phosphate-dependent aminotransferase [Ginsengibacter hankyongi]|uniref:Aminotransferase n=1 Tax=Ginsengibacter hankyongi TaxID=2607284 RepID=A0A5J5II19_9BACT|nr:pyridoxal phosphate-dependent aminotransferase [Ginsengibacter hankyongi]KAA9040660.1 pyridoxal phosphate-dependent aminotransferase [Ginsengibacter hankyongi]
MQLSSNLLRFNEPETLKMAKLSRELRASGIDVVDLSVGEPDFNTPEHIKEAAKKAIDENWSHYTPVPGYLELREAICRKLQRDNGLTYTPQQIVVSTGAKQSIANVMLSILDDDDEIIIPTPYWVSYSEIARFGRGKVIFVHTTPEAGFKLTPEQLEAAITPKTKLFIFSSPCNPTGAVYTKIELEGLAKVFQRHPGIFIISDEIYEYINYAQDGGGGHQSIAQFDYLKDRIIIVNGLSKGFAMTGWRLGYIAAPVEVAKACEKIQGQFTSGTNSIAQRAAITALDSPLSATHEMVKEFKVRKQRVMELLKEIPNIRYTEPDGAFYIFPEVKYYFGKKAGDEVINNASDLCMYLLNTAHVSTVSGDAFGEPSCIRISFANNMKNIEEGLRRIKKGVEVIS